MIPTRGERNFNPGNLDRVASQHWQGQDPDQSGDPRFVVFTEPVWGVRALAKTLLTYYRKYSRNTVRRIINRWAPSGENNTPAYVTHVAALLKVQPDDVIDVENVETLTVLTKAIIAHENGRISYDDALIADAVGRALGG